MEDKDFTKCFVFHDMDWVQDILHMSELGLWNMVTDKDMQNVKFYIDGTMARLLGQRRICPRRRVLSFGTSVSTGETMHMLMMS